MGSPCRSSIPANSASKAIQEELSAKTLTEILNHSHAVWKLQTDEAYNAALREDFYFEQVIIVAKKYIGEAVCIFYVYSFIIVHVIVVVVLAFTVIYKLKNLIVTKN